uniref:Uncharacterized protein n=1 Tax=Acrobeloides nanus TaxID=290746 RepID=A0A914CX22_9BILA
MVLFKNGVAIADSCLTVVGLACDNDFAVVCNFEVDNFTNQTLIHKKLELIHGEIPHPPRDIQPGVKLKFGSRKGSYTLYGVGAICTWEFKNRLIVVFWQVPLSGVGGDNILGLAITYPGITHSDISLDRIQCGTNTYAFENYCEGVTSKTADGKIFKTSYFREFEDSTEWIEVEDKDIIVRGIMGTSKHCQAHVEIIPHSDNDFADKVKNEIKKQKKRW